MKQHIKNEAHNLPGSTPSPPCHLWKKEDIPELLARVMVSFSCLPFIVVAYSPITNQSFSSFLGYYIETNKGIKRYYKKNLCV